jgi:hypothetical protein
MGSLPFVLFLMLGLAMVISLFTWLPGMMGFSYPY